MGKLLVPNHAILLLGLCSLILRWSVSLFPYSGYANPPMHGDFEAQRHWQEITTNLPMNDWYINTTDNDLLYWGLDYPPLTAYHSWVMGKIAGFIDPQWVALNDSRGIETTEHKLFMRLTVLVSDLLVLLPAVAFYLSSTKMLSHQQVDAAVVNLLLHPGLILIDYGHFQYNGVSLGFFIFAVACLSKSCMVLGSIAFCLALNYKQMELYHALPFFVYILSKCVWNNQPFGYRLKQLISVGLAVIVSFSILWAPFLTSKESALAVVARLFPFNRGLFEDKVANFWCSLNVVIKLKTFLPQPTIVTMCAVVTLLAIIPSLISLFKSPSISKFKYALVVSSLSFFLFSYQVHEKTILIPAISIALLSTEEPVATVLFSITATFSMLPLLIKDGLLPAMVALIILYTTLCYQLIPSLHQMSKYIKGLVMMSAGVMVTLAYSYIYVAPPVRYPDLWPVLVSLYSCGLICLSYLYFNYKLVLTD